MSNEPERIDKLFVEVCVCKQHTRKLVMKNDVFNSHEFSLKELYYIEFVDMKSDLQLYIIRLHDVT